MRKLRPSLLPKLAACAAYASEEFAGAAADRGTEMDVHFRALISAQSDEDKAFVIGEMKKGLEPDAVGSVLWAVEISTFLARGEKLEANEEDLRIVAFDMDGTADLLCPRESWSADLKSGQRRNYLQQQAAYALGFMDKFFEDEWTVYILYADLREYDRLHFTREEAEKLIREQIARANDPLLAPTPCDYCGWCANRFNCIPRLELAMPFVPVVEASSPEEAFELVLADNNKLVAFIKACKVVKDLDEKARETAKNRLVEGKKDGLKFKGVSLVTKKGSEVFPAEELVDVAKKLGPKRILSTFGSISKAKAEDLYREAGMELPKEKLIQTAGSTHVQCR